MISDTMYNLAVKAGSRLSSDAPLAFEEVYRKWFTEVTRFARALGCRPEDLEDVAQEVFLVVRRKLDGFDGQNFGGWLYTITRNTVSGHRRAAWFRRVLSLTRTERLEDFQDPGEDAVSKLERKEAQRLVLMLAKKIHSSRRDTFLLFELEGYRGEEIATLLEIPVATVWTRLHLARKEFLAAVSAFRIREGEDRDA
jgi:RNA polymerase sigma-70 factor (ECF subfamily)